MVKDFFEEDFYGLVSEEELFQEVFMWCIYWQILEGIMIYLIEYLRCLVQKWLCLILVFGVFQCCLFCGYCV